MVIHHHHRGKPCRLLLSLRSAFETKNHIAAWAGLAPRDNESAGKLKPSRTKKANVYIKSILTECAWAATRARGTRLSNWYWRNEKRLGAKKAITAVARKLLVYIYTMLKNGELYDGSLDVADTERHKAQKLESARKTVERQTCNPNTKKHREDMASDAPVADPLTDQHAAEDNVLAITEPCQEIICEPSKRRRGRPRKDASANKVTNSQTN